MMQEVGNTGPIGVAGKYRSAFLDIFRAIEHLHREMGYPDTTCMKEERLGRHRDLCLALHAEVDELLDAMPWKPWRGSEYKALDWENLKEEAVDVLMFLGAIRELWHVDCEAFADAFEKKLVENRQRSQNGYNRK